MSLAKSYDDGRAAAHVAFKIAGELPTMRIVKPGAGIRTSVTPSAPPVGLPEGVTHVPLPAGGGMPGPAAPQPGMLSGLKRTLGYGALGAGAVAAYGMHHQNEEDRRRNALVYAPMGGGYG